MRTNHLHAAALVAHRVVGLAIAVFLIVAGTTGMMMAFYFDLDRALNPELFVVAPPSPGAPLLDPIELRDRLNAQLPVEHRVVGVILDLEPRRTVNYWVDDHETFVDPYTGRIVGSRTFGSPWEGRKSILTFFYRLHFSLALDDVGHVAMGIVALLWTFDCFVGAYLTFPRPTPPRAGGARGPSWLRRWLGSWALNTSKLFSLIFSFHRASGLWVWGLLLVFAWSSVALNLGPVYEPITNAVFGKAPDVYGDLPELPAPRPTPAIEVREALAIGRRLMAAEQVRRGFRIVEERGLFHDPERGVYSYYVESDLDLAERFGETEVLFDADTGRSLGFDAPTGRHAGATFTSVIIALHFGAIRQGGVAYRAFVCAFGLVVTLLSASGVWIWWKKRPGRVRGAKRKARRSPDDSPSPVRRRHPTQ